MADGAVGNVKFPSRLGKTEVPGGHFEAPQGVQRRQSFSHVSPVSFFNKTYEKRSFEINSFRRQIPLHQQRQRLINQRRRR
jgi:hypothetical protein